ncbi:unnamed protein product [Ixodes persulcatus]
MLKIFFILYRMSHSFVRLGNVSKKNGEVTFCSSSGVSVDSFLELLSFYLAHTYVSFEGDLYVQKKGICIGSRVAPVLCDILLSSCDNAILEKLRCDGKNRIFRYVDDFLIFSEAPEASLADAVSAIMRIFGACADGLTFTFETPTAGKLQFLDIKLSFLEDHICWAYKPRSKKAILPFESAHSKLVKRGIAKTCLEAALKKSCEHSVQESFARQITKLQEAGFPQRCLTEVAEGLVKKDKRNGQTRP